MLYLKKLEIAKKWRLEKFVNWKKIVNYTKLEIGKKLVNWKNIQLEKYSIGKKNYFEIGRVEFIPL